MRTARERTTTRAHRAPVRHSPARIGSPVALPAGPTSPRSGPHPRRGTSTPGAVAKGPSPRYNANIHHIPAKSNAFLASPPKITIPGAIFDAISERTGRGGPRRPWPRRPGTARGRRGSRGASRSTARRQNTGKPARRAQSVAGSSKSKRIARRNTPLASQVRLGCLPAFYTWYRQYTDSSDRT
jgi:hypothetical protein